MGGARCKHCMRESQKAMRVHAGPCVAIPSPISLSIHRFTISSYIGPRACTHASAYASQRNVPEPAHIYREPAARHPRRRCSIAFASAGTAGAGTLSTSSELPSPPRPPRRPPAPPVAFCSLTRLGGYYVRACDWSRRHHFFSAACSLQLHASGACCART